MPKSINDHSKHHIFLAYHGDDKTGSQKEAESIYRLLKSLYGDSLDIYFHPICAPNASYHDTPKEVKRSSFFLLVAKENIPVDETGEITKINRNGELSDLYQEVDVFYESVFKKRAQDNRTLAKVIRVGDLSESKAEDFFVNMFKSENYRYEEILSDFKGSLFFRNWFSRTYFYSDLVEIKDNSLENPAKPKPKHQNWDLASSSIEDGIYETDFLLSHHYSVDMISERHVYLDNLTVDNEKYSQAMSEEVEGDAETWEDMISATADCTANLIVGGEIVGYMDFLPVETETYDLLKTKPFDKDDVAYYSFGGDYDIFGSMFSIDLNYATPKNYQLFFKWMVDKILNWRKEGIYIHRILFSIYSNNQAKALGQLGFKKILENELKGMLMEVTVEELLENRFVKAKLLGQGSAIVYDARSRANSQDVYDCKQIAYSHSHENGGMLHFLDAVTDSDVLLTAKRKQELVGYIALRHYPIFPNGIYIEQIAVKKELTHQGIGKGLLREAVAFCQRNHIRWLYANCRKANYPSYSLFISSGFSLFEMDEATYLHIGFADRKSTRLNSSHT